METRAKRTAEPDVVTAIQQLVRAVHAGGVEPRLLQLVHLRTSQINGCSPCVVAGVEGAKPHGETDTRLHAVAAWRETPYFTDEERAALALAEAATRVQDGAAGVTDGIREAAAAHFTEEQMGTLVLEVALTNFFNRINRANRVRAGAGW
ncbi:carboxymuconolactone decarboxylase family protein [Streptomyces sp. RFCAC02]|uniref:carboxymuconolactone decarboxylase family protein n=1 Tax=Streptomyces sp. RFCAC02 TaxID=2499143 RepID=UPI00101EFE54|nr:carboxymuconolactone decarboxylase family protein [Streptomyces sp. RFCAC02]